MTAGKKAFVAARNDGFGERLKAILNAMVLAEAFNRPFRFHWPVFASGSLKKFHTVPPAEEIFGREFLDAHYIETFDRTAYTTVAPPAKSKADIRKLMSASKAGLCIDQQTVSTLYQSTAATPLTEGYVTAFRRIGFTPHLTQKIEIARQVDIPEKSVAVHLRAGDIIYGSYRFSSVYSGKTMCYSVAKRVMERLIKQGKYPLIFGQDLKTCRLLANKFGLKLGIDFLGDMGDDAMASALGEIIVMSRCEEIYAGTSGFAKVAGWIGDKRLVKSQGRNLDLAEYILADGDLTDPSIDLADLQRSFSLFMVAYYGLDVLPDNQVLSAIDQALSYDPGNVFYSLIKAKLEARNQDLVAAEATLRAGVTEIYSGSKKFDGSLLAQVLDRVLVRKRAADKVEILSYVNSLPEHAAPERPYTTFVAAAAAQIQGRHEDARQLIRLCRGAEPDNLLFQKFPR